MKLLFVGLAVLGLTGCSVFGDSGVESAPYTLISADEAKQIEVRNYDSMILVSASMQDSGRNSAFRKLFSYITGANQGAKEIAMTAPVFMDEKQAKGTEIAMTAPVFMDESGNGQMMSFVMPKHFTLETTPTPTDPDVVVTEVSDYKVAAIKFNGTLRDGNIERYTNELQAWINANGYTQISKPIQAGYNGPLTIPMFRHNEILIEIE
ncbi:heme-binding protein [Glaciecola sp. XM2]|uniref:SOUL family heme-binding protein n=1 Tax=Glaciecola sp. XM2 TaxID=1914931 RepID=UPI001BDE87FE|nr:heme-binding protein [Glaciecola sp. XM2]MBT1451487.1 heme-binding protein [Glaciecola sp. XM2]